MKSKAIILIMALFLLLPTAGQAAAKPYAGRFLLQVESYGRAWYVYPKTGERYYLKDGTRGLAVLRSLGLEIAQKDLAKIPAEKGHSRDAKLVNRHKGYILLPLENKDEAWYVNPDTGYRYRLTDGQSALELIKKFALGIKNRGLKKIPVNSAQLVPDFTFSDVAYVKYDGANFRQGYYADKLLAPASITKLMTALVFLDLQPDWNKNVILSQAAMSYPALYVGEDKTSEIDCQAGDVISTNGLWVAMLLASSNQATAALVDATGLSRPDFIKLMNDKAKTLGLKKTVFYDVAGLDSHNVTTAKEMALIAQAAFAQEKIAETTRLPSYHIAALADNQELKDIEVTNRNYSLLQYKPDGAKTGYLVEAQRTAALKKGQNIIVVMHALSMKQRNRIIEALLQ